MAKRGTRATKADRNDAARKWARGRPAAEVIAAAERAGVQLPPEVDQFRAKGATPEVRAIFERLGLGDHPGIVAGALPESIAAPLVAALETSRGRVTPDGGVAALTEVYEARPKPPDLRADPLLPAVRMDMHPDKERGMLMAGYVDDRPPLPLFPDAGADDRLRVPLLEIVDAAGVGAVAAKGRGAPLVARLIHSAILSRTTDNDRIAVSQKDLIDMLAGPDPRGGRLEAWRRIRGEVCRLDSKRIPWPGGLWRPVLCQSEPGDGLHPDDPVVLIVSVPPGSHTGPPIDRRALMDAGRSDGKAYRAAIAAPTLAWIPGRTRRPAKGGRWYWSADPDDYTVIGPDDRKRIVHGPARPGSRRTLADADDAFRRAPGVRVVDEHARAPDGSRGWLVLPEAAADAVSKRR